MGKFVQREKALIKAMKAEDFATFDHDEKEAYDTLEGAFASFTNYGSIVIRMETMMPIWKTRCSGADYADRVSNIDRQRHNAHEAAIVNIRLLNRLSESYGLPPFADINTDDRHAVAGFIGQFMAEIYADGTDTAR